MEVIRKTSACKKKLNNLSENELSTKIIYENVLFKLIMKIWCHMTRINANSKYIWSTLCILTI